MWWVIAVLPAKPGSKDSRAFWRKTRHSSEDKMRGDTWHAKIANVCIKDTKNGPTQTEPAGKKKDVVLFALRYDCREN